jgi:hypothetical protein
MREADDVPHPRSQGSLALSLLGEGSDRNAALMEVQVREFRSPPRLVSLGRIAAAPVERRRAHIRQKGSLKPCEVSVII